jgi:hypothetical protein
MKISMQTKSPFFVPKHLGGIRTEDRLVQLLENDAAVCGEDNHRAC